MLSRRSWHYFIMQILSLSERGAAMGTRVCHVFIIGCKGIPAKYGGYETFVDKLTEYHEDDDEIQYHVACKSDRSCEFTYHNAACFGVHVPNIGAAQAVSYDIMAFRRSLSYIKQHRIERPIVYMLTCRIGPFLRPLYRELHRLGGVLLVNPDGHEWLRAKWPEPVKKYWKLSEALTVRFADLLICDSINIERYIKTEYRKYSPNTRYISYGAEVYSRLGDDPSGKIVEWLERNRLKDHGYYLIVGRFVPENNYETMLREYLASSTKRPLVIVSNVDKNSRFWKELRQKTRFDQDPRVQFVGTIYDQELLTEVRAHAYAYIHGHEVGGTNPSLLEALGSTSLNLLLDVGFNHEVGLDAALYWTKKNGSLRTLINSVDTLPQAEIEQYSKRAKARISSGYSWDLIASSYKKLFADICGSAHSRSSEIDEDD